MFAFVEGREDLYPKVEELLVKFPQDPRFLIPVLQAVQEQWGYLPPEALEKIAAKLGISLSRVYGVATFYSQFKLTSPGKHLVQVCKGTACHVQGAPALLEVLKERLGQEENAFWSVEVVRCVGCCSLAPVMVVDGKVYGRLTPDKAVKILERIDAGAKG